MRFTLLTIQTFGILFLISCTPPAETHKPFSHELGDGPAPWSSVPTGRNNDQFTFAIISDLNGGEREGIFNVAAQQIKLLRPDFVITAGDLVDGGTEDVAELKKQYDSFDERASKAGAPIVHVGGNHDLTNATMKQFWRDRYGRTYYHFIYNNVLFLVLDSEDYSPERMQEIYEARAKAIEILDGDHPEEAATSDYYQMEERISGEIGNEQSAYFEKVIADHPEVRWTLLFMHKPVWQREGDGNLSRIEKALGERNYTVFNAHFHSYAHSIRNNKDYIMLGTTGGGQNPKDPNSFDHITLVSFMEDQPSIATLRMDGILDKTGKIPLNGDTLCFQASKCAPNASAH